MKILYKVYNIKNTMEKIEIDCGRISLIIEFEITDRKISYFNIAE